MTTYSAEEQERIGNVAIAMGLPLTIVGLAVPVISIRQYMLGMQLIVVGGAMISIGGCLWAAADDSRDSGA